VKIGDRVITTRGGGLVKPGDEGTVTYVTEKAHWIGVKFDTDPNEHALPRGGFGYE